MRRDEIREYYEGRYSTESGETFPADPSRYERWFASLPPHEAADSRMLDYGCGVGYVCTLFAERGYSVTGIDISPSAIRLARRREPRATFLEASGDGSLPFPDRTFDVIACLGVLEHVPEPLSAIREVRRVACADAIGIWVVPNSWSPFFWFGHGTEQIEEHPRSLGAWCALLEEGGWRVANVRRDPGPIDRPVARWKRLAQGVMNRLPLQLTYQFVIETRPTA